MDSLLIPCERIHGGSLVSEDRPAIQEARNVFFRPVAHNSTSLFQSNGRVVPEAVYYQGLAHLHTPFGSLSASLEHGDFEPAPDEFEYVYVGHISDHYGHFLLSSLPRFWSLGTTWSERTRFVYNEPISPEALFSRPFVAEIFGALGLRPTDFMQFPKGAHFSRILVPALSFEENNLGYRVFARLCNRIGNILTTNMNVRPSEHPVYLSKHKLKRGISQVVNEIEIVQEMERLGIEVICPEELSLTQQIMLWKKHPILLGVIGSAFHTGIFVPRPRCIIVNHGPEIWSNQIILDRINRSKVDYYYPQGDFRNEGPNGSFGNNFVAADPVRIARELSNLAGDACSRHRT